MTNILQFQWKYQCSLWIKFYSVRYKLLWNNLHFLFQLDVSVVSRIIRGVIKCRAVSVTSVFLHCEEHKMLSLDFFAPANLITMFSVLRARNKEDFSMCERSPEWVWIWIVLVFSIRTYEYPRHGRYSFFTRHYLTVIFHIDTWNSWISPENSVSSTTYCRFHKICDSMYYKL